MAAATQSLPTEIWNEIVGQLYLPELLHLSLSCTRLRAICKQRLEEQAQLFRKYNHFDNGSGPSDRHAFHTLLLLILRKTMPVTYVEDLGWHEEIRMQTEDDLYDEHGRSRCDVPTFTNEEEDLFRQAVKSSPWIYEHEAERCSRLIMIGNEDALFCVLIPLLTELRSFCMPLGLDLFLRIAGRIAKESVEQLDANRSELRDMPLQKVSLPLQKLVLVISLAFNSEGPGISLHELAHIAAIPSVRRICPEAAQSYAEPDFTGWPDELPRSRASEVCFIRSDLSAGAIRRFAQGFEGPCVIRQHFRSDWSHDPFEWDHYTISGEIDPLTGRIKEGTRQETLEKKYEIDENIYNPFHDEWDWRGDYYWVSVDGEKRFRRWSEASDGINAIMSGEIYDWKNISP